MSIDGIKSFISSITNNKVNLSKGTIYSWKEKISERLSKSEYEKIEEELLNSLVLHVDETPIKINGEQYYIHNISNETHTLQYVNKKRGEDAIKEFDFLEKYQGILVHDHFSMYYNYGIGHAECNVHITKYLNGVIDFTTHTWAKQMKELLLEAKAKKESFITQHKNEMSNEIYEEFKEKEYVSFKKRYLDSIKLGINEYYSLKNFMFHIQIIVLKVM
ncbi:MAG: IS66 family transposase [Bacilli bacterium]|nr:IS66 family transposase [Bacilli bacterium]